MLNRLKELWERLLDQVANQWNRFTETSVYIQIHEKYEDLSASKQRAVQVGLVFLGLIILFSVPMSYFSSASDEMTRFESLRQLTRDLLRVTRTQDAPAVQSVPASQLVGRIQDELKAFRLSTEQIKKVEVIAAEQMKALRLAPAQIQEEGVQVLLSGLNLKQIVDVSHRLSNMGETFKLSGLNIQSTAKAGLFDITLQVSSFSASPTKDEKSPKKGKKRSLGVNE